jgi:hypothetical protein
VVVEEEERRVEVWFKENIEPIRRKKGKAVDSLI